MQAYTPFIYSSPVDMLKLCYYINSISDDTNEMSKATIKVYRHMPADFRVK